MANDVFNRLMQSASAAASIKQGGNIAQVANTQNIDYSRQADGAKAVISNPVSSSPAAATAPAISTKPQSTDKSDVLGDTLKNLGLLNSDYAAKEKEYKAAQDAYTKAMQNAPADADFDTYLQPYRDRANAAEAALRSSRQNYENAGGVGHSYSGEDRVSDIIKGGLGNSGTGAVNAAGSIYEGNVRGATSDWERELQNLRDQRTEAIQTYRDTLQRYGGDENNRNVQAALRQVQRISEDMGMYNKALRGESDLLNTANRLYDTADNLSAASARDVARAKEGLGTVGQFAVDAGVAGVQMLGDAAIGAATGTGMLPVMGLRSYGSAAQEARQAGAGYEGQALYGIGSAAVEMLTEKIADGLAGLAGKGAADDVAEEVIRRLASSDTGRTVLRQLYGMSGEAFEEAISSLANPALRALYDKGAAAKESYGTAEGRKALLADTAYDSLVGAALGGAGSFGSVATGQNAQKNTDLRLADAGFGGVDSQVNDAWDVLTGRTTAEQQAAKERAAQQRLGILDLIQPTQTAAETAPVQEAAETPAEAPQPVAPESAPAEAPAAESAPAPALNISTGDATEEQLRAEWEAQHPEAANPEPPSTPAPAEQPSQPTPPAPAAPAANNSGESGQGLPPTDTTTAESTNGRGRERERGVSKDVRINPNTDKPLRDSFEQNREMYHQLTNAEVTERANAIIDKGFDAARSEVEQAIGRAKAGMKLPPEIAVAGYQIANEMSRRGDLEAARNLCADIAAELTAGGQLGQIGRLILNSDRTVRGMTVQKIVDKLNDGLSERQKAKNRNRGVGDENGQISVDDALVDSYVNAEDDAAASAALEQIEQNIADQIPATFRDKFTALRYLNMLGNLKTQDRNIIGNTLMLVATNAKYTAQSVAELAAAAASGGKYQRNTSLFTNADLRRQAAADFDANIDEIKGESRYADVAKQSIRSIADKQRIFDSKILEGARKATNWAMDQGDVIFMRAVYTRAFAGWMQAHGVTDVANATADQLSSARAFAAKEAQEATFHDSNAVSDWVSRIGRGQNTPAAVRAVSEGIMPFRKTPANVGVRAVEYSPVGIAETVYKGVQAAKGNATAADVINSAAKNVTGTALAIAGFFLAAAGKARGSGNDEDKELNDFQKMQGAMDYSVKIGDTHISLSQFAPSAIPFFMGVKLQELLTNNEDLSLDDIGDMLGVISDPMLEMSMLQGVNDLLGDIASLNGNTDAIPSLVANAALSYLSQGLTNTLLGQAEQASEANRQTTYSDTKSKDANAIDQLLGSKGQYQIGKMSAKMPGWDYNQQDYVDAWGRTQSNGESGKRIINAFINPTYLSGDRSTKVDTELERLHNENADVEGFPNVFPQKRSRSATIGDGVVMTPDEYLQYSKAAGQKKLKLVSDFMDSAEYKTLTDTQRAEVIQNLYSFADDLALQGIKRDNGITKQSDYQKLLSGTYSQGGTEKRPPLKEENIGEYISFDTAYRSAKNDNNYQQMGDLLGYYTGLDKNTREVLASKDGYKDLPMLAEFDDPAEYLSTVQRLKDEAAKTDDDFDPKTNAGFETLTSGKMKSQDLDTLAPYALSKTRLPVYETMRAAGFEPKAVFSEMSKADTNGNGNYSQTELFAWLAPIGALTSEDKQTIWETLNPNGKTPYADYAKKHGGDQSKESAPAATGQTQNVIDYLLNLGRN